MVYLWPAFVAVARKKLFPECHQNKERTYEYLKVISMSI